MATGKRWTIFSQGGLNITPALSPDGNFLAFASSHEGNSEIYRLDTRTKANQRLTVNPSGDLSPSWSPTGRELAFVSDRGGGPQLFLMSADGSNVRRLTFEGDYNAAPSGRRGATGSPTSQDLLGKSTACVITPDGQKRMQLTTGAGWTILPHGLRTDGIGLQFDGRRKSHIYTIDADGKDLERLTFGSHSQQCSDLVACILR